MHPVFRSALGIGTGILAGGALVAVIEGLGHRLVPLPPGVDPTDPESLRRALDQIPPAALLFVLAAWGCGALAGGWIAARIAARAHVGHALGVGALLQLAGLVQIALIPHPAWFNATGMLVFLPAAWLGGRAARGMAT